MKEEKVAKDDAKSRTMENRFTEMQIDNIRVKTRPLVPQDCFADPQRDKKSISGIRMGESYPSRGGTAATINFQRKELRSRLCISLEGRPIWNQGTKSP